MARPRDSSKYEGFRYSSSLYLGVLERVDHGPGEAKHACMEVAVQAEGHRLAIGHCTGHMPVTQPQQSTLCGTKPLGIDCVCWVRLAKHTSQQHAGEDKEQDEGSLQLAVLLVLRDLQRETWCGRGVTWWHCVGCTGVGEHGGGRQVHGLEAGACRVETLTQPDCSPCAPPVQSPHPRPAAHRHPHPVEWL